jgi:hypothetical protein
VVKNHPSNIFYGGLVFFWGGLFWETIFKSLHHVELSDKMKCIKLEVFYLHVRIVEMS